MKIKKVIEAKHWINKVTGQTASVYGAIPYTSLADKNNWEIATVGWTWVRSDGCIGLGRTPAKTKLEAIDIMNRINERIRR